MKSIDRRKLEAGEFVTNNGRVLRTINILRYKYNRLKSVESVLKEEGIDNGDFLDSVNFLSEEGYIHLRHIATPHDTMSLSDCDYSMIEAKLTAKGIRLLAGGIDDDMIEV